MMEGKTVQACIYDPLLGKFTQPDTIIPNPGNPQALNRFSYVGNSPIIFVDPSGHVACDKLGLAEDIGACEIAKVSTAEGFNNHVAGLNEPYAQMPSQMDISEDGLNFIESQEGFEPTMYNDGCAYNDIDCKYDQSGGGAGHCTVGIGHLVHREPCDGRAEEEPFRNGLSYQGARAQLAVDVQSSVAVVQELVTKQLTQLQFDALVSLVFNWGKTPFSNSPKLQLINDGDYFEAGQHFNEGPITSNGVVMEGLIKRRRLESLMFLSPVGPDFDN